MPPQPPSPDPSTAQIFIAAHRAPILTATVVAHIAHWNYLTRFRRLDPASRAHRGQFARPGLAWAGVYIGVLATITLSMRAVKNSSDRILRTRYP